MNDERSRVRATRDLELENECFLSARKLYLESESILEREDLLNMKGRIIIMGGTFDPFHLGHLSTGRAVREIVERRDGNNTDAQTSLIYIPTPRNPFKENAPSLSGRERVEMIAKAVESFSDIYVSPIEVDKELTIDDANSALDSDKRSPDQEKEKRLNPHILQILFE